MALPEKETLAALGAFVYGSMQGYVYDGASADAVVRNILFGASLMGVSIDND